MAEVTKTYEEATFYECDKCHGYNHEETRFEDDLNKVVFGAQIYDSNVRVTDPDTMISPFIAGEHEYLLCDECMERAHDYLADFF